MPYIGHSPTQAGTFYIIDDLTMSSSTGYNMQVGGVDVTPNVDNLLITLDGVVQHPGDAYTVSGSTLTFASGPGSGVDFFGIIMGQSASFGEGSIGADELKVTGDGSSGQVLASDGDGTFTWTTDTENYLPLAGGALTGAVTTNSTFDGVDIATRDAILSSTTTTAGAALPKAGGTMSGNIAMGGNDISGGGTITGTFVGGITGNVTGNASGTALTVTQAAQSAITSVGTLTSLTTSGNIGLGATPDTWHSSYDALQGANFSLSTDASAGASKSVTLAYNQYIDSGNAWTYINADEASYYQQYNGAHYFATAGAGSADGDVTNSTKLTIYNSGQCEHVSTSDAIAVFNSTHANGTYLSLQASGTQIGYIGSAKALITGSHATNDLTIRSQSDLYFTTGGTSDEALRIDPSQNATFGGIVTTGGALNAGVNGVTCGTLTTSSSGEVKALFENTSTSSSQFAYVDIESNATSAGQAIVRFKTPDGTSLINSLGSGTQITMKDGNVGIGTTSPDRLLDVSGTGNVYGKFQSTNATGAGVEVKDTGEDWLIQADGGIGALAFYDLGRSAYRMVINDSGKIHLGAVLSESVAVAANATAHVVGDVFAVGASAAGGGSVIYMISDHGRPSGGTHYISIHMGASSSGAVSKGQGSLFMDTAGGKLYIDSSHGTSPESSTWTVVGTQTSIRSEKQDITSFTDYDSMLSIVNNAPLNKFKYKKEVDQQWEDNDQGLEERIPKVHLGFIADEVDELFMGTDTSIDQVSVNGILMACIKSLSAKVTALENA